MASSDQRTTAQIEADLGATRDRLTGAVTSLIDTVHPNRIKQRQLASAKHFARVELESAKSLIFNARGDLRKERLAVAGGALAGFVSFVIILKAVVARARKR